MVTELAICATRRVQGGGWSKSVKRPPFFGHRSFVFLVYLEQLLARFRNVQHDVLNTWPTPQVGT